MRLGDILVAAGKTTPEQLAAALPEGEADGDLSRLGERLVLAGIVTGQDVAEALAQRYGISWRIPVPADWLDPELVAELPVEWARANRVLPVRTPDGVRVLTPDPGAVEVLDDLALLLRQEIVPVVTSAGEVARAIEQCYYQRDDSAREFLSALRGQDPAHPAEPAHAGSDDLLRMADQAPVTQLVNLILLDAVKARASDIHIEPFESRLQIRYRIDGLLYEQSEPPKRLEAALVSRLKVMGRLDIAEKRLPQDGMARVRVGEREIDVRVSTVPVAEGERVVLRLLNRESALIPLAELGLPAAIGESFQTLLHQPNGVILVTGPTGSGKTTTLYAALQELDTAHLNVLTVEDPIEYQLPRIGQIQVKPKIGLTFAHGLRHILRQDPDVVLVGEIRDLETAEICVRASLTGHLVFSTLHTNDAVSAVLRMVDMGIPPYLLASSVRAALAQRLVRRLCPHCRRPIEGDDRVAAGLGEAGKRLLGTSLHEPGQCNRCLGGYTGRLGIFELLVAGPAIRDGIRSGMDPAALARLAVEQGMRPLVEDGVAKILAGDTSPAELQRAVGHLG
jgi:general secretion pathway protein E